MLSPVTAGWRAGAVEPASPTPSSLPTAGCSHRPPCCLHGFPLSSLSTGFSAFVTVRPQQDYTHPHTHTSLYLLSEVK